MIYYFVTFSAVFLLSSFNFDIIIFGVDEVLLKEKICWGLVDAKNEVVSHQGIEVEKNIFISTEVISVDKPVEFYGLRVTGLGDNLNDKIFDKFKSTNKNDVIRFKEQISSELEKSGEYSFRYYFLNPFMIVSVVAIAGGIIFMVLKKMAHH